MKRTIVAFSLLVAGMSVHAGSATINGQSVTLAPDSSRFIECEDFECAVQRAGVNFITRDGVSYTILGEDDVERFCNVAWAFGVSSNLRLKIKRSAGGRASDATCLTY